MIRIITDSTSDISNELASQLNIEVLPLSVHFGEEVFKSGVEISNEEFYKRLVNDDQLPTTSQINPYDFEVVFKKYIEAGDDIVVITIASTLSGTYQSAVIAKNAIDADNIYLIDSKTASFALGILAMNAAKLRDAGKSAKEISETITSLIPKVHVYICVDTLEYLKKGGRISSSTAFIGGIMGIHPIITIEDGKVETVGKARGNKASYQFMMEKYESTNIDPDSPVVVGHAVAEDRMLKLKDMLVNQYDINQIYMCEVGPVVGTHMGPYSFGIGIVEK